MRACAMRRGVLLLGVSVDRLRRHPSGYSRIRVQLMDALWGLPALDEKHRIEQRLERLRRKLLDLSTTNRMLSFRHPRASCLRIVDELPHQPSSAPASR